MISLRHDDKIVGTDNVGALFIMDKNPYTGNIKTPFCYWSGSILNTKYTKNVLKDKYFGPTIIQVMAGILSAVSWMYKNKNKGLLFGEDLDDDYILKLAKPYLGTYYSGAVPYNIKLPGTTLDKLIINDKTNFVKIDEI